VPGDKIVGLVDWEFSDWYPLYWEYVSAWHVNSQNTFWEAELAKFMGPFPRELEIDKLRRRHFGECWSTSSQTSKSLLSISSIFNKCQALLEQLE
jgi:hypothetical protein